MGTTIYDRWGGRHVSRASEIVLYPGYRDGEGCALCKRVARLLFDEAPVNNIPAVCVRCGTRWNRAMVLTSGGLHRIMLKGTVSK